jgi:hypothetical protein
MAALLFAGGEGDFLTLQKFGSTLNKERPEMAALFH